MNNKYEYTIFDLDGTLLNTKEGVISAIIHTIKKSGMDMPNQNELESFIGPPIQNSFKRLYNLSNDESMKIANAFRDTYQREEFLFKAEPYKGIFELMKKLTEADIKIGIATYKREDYTKRLLHEKGFDRYTKNICGSDFKGNLTKKEIICRCMKEMGCKDYTKAVYIGDGKSDAIGAQSAGIAFIAITYGFGFKSVEDTNEFKPIGVADSCCKIGDILLYN